MRGDTRNGGNEAQVTTLQSWDFLGLSCCVCITRHPHFFFLFWTYSFCTVHLLFVDGDDYLRSTIIIIYC